MSKVEITTNRHKRPTVSYNDLTITEREEFIYIEENDKEQDRFFRYANWVYDTCEFAYQGINSELGQLGWTRAQSDTMWSATIFYWVRDEYGCEWEVIVGRAYWA